MRVALTTGRYQLAHKGHIQYLVSLTYEFSYVVIGIGSCFEFNTERNPILALDREKMLRKALHFEGADLSKVIFVNIQDYNDFDSWIKDIIQIRDKYNVTHFVTGNKEDILEPTQKLGLDLGMELINPETRSSTDIHASRIRELIKENKIFEALDMVHPTVVNSIAETGMMDNILQLYTSDIEMGFVPGRQCVDCILFVEDEITGEPFIIAGNRAEDKENFPGCIAIPGGGIEKFDTAVGTVIKEFEEETGLALKTVNLMSEPALFTLDKHNIKGLLKLYFINVFGSYDESLAGNQGGSSQVFGAYIKCNVNELSKQLKSESDLKNVRLISLADALKMKFAYQQSEMIREAMYKTGAYKALEKFEINKNKNKTIIINILGGPGQGKSTLAARIFAFLKMQNINAEYVQEFAKELYYDGTLKQVIEDKDQLYIGATQNRKFTRLPKYNVDVIITDGSTLTNMFHAQDDKTVFDAEYKAYNEFDNRNLFIVSDGSFKYQEDGRLESEIEAKNNGFKMQNMLERLQIPYTFMYNKANENDSIDISKELKKWLYDIIKELK